MEKMELKKIVELLLYMTDRPLRHKDFKEILGKEYPEEKDVSRQEPRIGVFVCHCGINIGGVVDVPAVAAYAKLLPNVVFSDDNLFTCSQDTQKRIKEMIAEHDLNRVIVSSCSPRTHEPLFRDSCKEAGLKDLILYLGGYLMVGRHDWKEAETKFKALGFDRVYPPEVDLDDVMRQYILQHRSAFYFEGDVQKPSGR